MNYILPELRSNEPFLRQRACHIYEQYVVNKPFKDQNHKKQIIIGLFQNMADDQPLPVKFHAAAAIEGFVRNEVGIDLIKPGLDVVIKCFLTLRNKLNIK